MSDPTEVEVKLAVSRPRRVARLIRGFEDEPLAGFVADGPPIRVTHTDRYLDSAFVGGRLEALGMRARLRRRGRTITLAVKHSGRERAGVTTRTELQAPATAALDPRRWPASAARTALVEALGDRQLVEIARLRQGRLTRVVRRGRTRVELSLDRVDALDRGRVIARRHELEAELLDGDEAALSSLAEALAAVPGIEPTAGSKVRFGRDARTRRSPREMPQRGSRGRLPLTLFIVRHADAGDPAHWDGDDADRPLSRKGRDQAERLGALLDALGIRPDAIRTSPKVRAADTAKLVAKRSGRRPEPDARLAAGFDADGLAALLAELEPSTSTLLVVGHDPDCSALLSWLVGAPLALGKGALARVELPDRGPEAGRGTLRWLLPPEAVAGWAGREARRS